MVTKKRGLTNEELKTEILEQVIGEMRTEIEDLKTENKKLKGWIRRGKMARGEHYGRTNIIY